jgi:hypothetical protein
MRRLPHQGARHSTVDHGFPSDGVFLLLHERVLPSRWLISLPEIPSSLSLACGWPPGANGALSLSIGGASRVLGLKILRVQGKGGRTGVGSGPGRTGVGSGPGRPAWAHLGPIWSPLRSRGSSCNYVLCSLHLHDFDDVIIASKMEVLFA